MTTHSSLAPPRRRVRWQLAVVLSAVMVFTTAGAALLPGTASAQPFQVGQYYQLIAVHSGKALDIAGISTEPGASLQQWDPTGGQNQHFRFESSGGGYYRVIARHSNLALDVFEWNADNGADIVQWTDVNGTNQQWTVIDRGNNEISLVNRFSGKALDVWEASQANGARVSQWDSTGNANQRFRLVPVGGGGGPGDRMPIRGGDVSTLPKNEAFGAVYYDAAGNRVDPLELLRDNGMNYARLKVWVNPPDGFNNQARVLEMAQRIKALDMGLLIDFHYSDSWADPGQQTKPAAWQNYSFNQLRTAVYNHTFEVLSALEAQGTPADIVQVGNEIRNGMLWPDGRTDNWNNLAQLLISGANAVNDVNSTTQVMLHLDMGGNNSTFRNWFDNATSRGVPFDIIGASYYCYWHGTLAALQNNLNDISARYGKPVAVMETSYGFTLENNDHSGNIFNQTHVDRCGYPATPAGQQRAVRDVFQVVADVPNGRGLGVFYWEPTWTAVEGSGWDPWDPGSGNAWENQALFDYNDRPLPAISVFSEF